MKRKHIIGRILSKISITKKIIIIFFGCVVIPVILQNLFYLNYTENNVQNEIFQKMNNSLDNISNKIDAIIEEIITLAARYNNDINLYRTLDNLYTNDISYYITYQDYIGKFFKSDLPFYLQIDSIILFSDNETIFNGAAARRFVPFDDNLSSVSLKKYDISNTRSFEKNLKLGIGLEYSHSKMSNQRIISIICDLNKYPQYSKFKKVLQIRLNTSYFNSLLANPSLFDNVLLTDSEENVLFSVNTFEQNDEYDKFEKSSLNNKYLLIEKQLSVLPLTLYGYYDSGMISDKFKDSIPVIITISMIGVAIALVSILTVGNNITRRTKKIVEKAAKISQGSFLNDDADKGEDELSQIEQSLDQMSKQLSEYIEIEYNAKLTQSRLERENTQAKLLALQSQVNPHFMFNALETIRLNALDGNKNETAKMIKNMSNMFRYLVNWDNDVICLKEEIRFLYKFLAIQKYRFGDEFNYTIDIDSKAENCYLPKLILQPLAENACLHGVEAVSNEKLIQINISTDSGRLIMKVRDNGGGIKTARLEKLKNMLGGGAKIEGSVGLYNVYERLVLYYGDDFDFTIDSVFGSGTECVVSLPEEYSFKENFDSV